jgi:hypothetical protein
MTYDRKTGTGEPGPDEEGAPAAPVAPPAAGAS